MSAINATAPAPPNAHHRGDPLWNTGHSDTTSNMPANTNPKARSDELSACCVRLRSSCATFPPP